MQHRLDLVDSGLLLALEALEVVAHGFKVHRFLFLERVQIARYVQILAIRIDFRHVRHMGELVHVYTLHLGGDNLLDMLILKRVLVLSGLEFLAGIDEQDVAATWSYANGRAFVSRFLLSPNGKTIYT